MRDVILKYWNAFRNSRVYPFLSNRYILIGVAALVFVLFFDKNSLVSFVRLEMDIYRQECLIRELKDGIESADARLEELDSDLNSLEKFAREQYLFCKEGETVFVVEEN